MILVHDEYDLRCHFVLHSKLVLYFGIGHIECCNQHLNWTDYTNRAVLPGIFCLSHPNPR